MACILNVILFECPSLVRLFSDNTKISKLTEILAEIG